MKRAIDKRIATIERAVIANDWRRYIGRPDSKWDADALHARTVEQLLGRPVPNIETMSDADLGQAIELCKAMIGDIEKSAEAQI